MNTPRTRREFLTEVGRGMVVAAVGYEVATDLGLASALGEETAESLSFGPLEPLVCLMQETPADRLLPALAAQLQSGTALRTLTAAAALANARTFGGEDYVGFHTMMALAPALHMAQELPAEMQALPVFKVLYRNTNRIQEFGGRKKEVLHQVKPAAEPATGSGSEVLREAVRRKEVEQAEQTFARLARGTPDDALNDLLFTVLDNTEVHRVVLPYRAWDLLGLIGKEQAHTLLRQSVRYCVKAESWPRQPSSEDSRALLPKLLEQHKLLGRSPGDRKAEDGWVDQMSQTIFKSSPSQAAEAAAAALADDMSPAALGEAITLAANQLILRDMGRTPRDEVTGKPIGSVHGDSIGVHACDSANAWRNLALVANSRNCFASLILGAYQVALDRTARGGDFLNWQPLPLARHLGEVKATDADGLRRELEEAIRGNLQAKASAVVQRYGESGHPPRPLFELMLRYAVSEDGALHAEKFYRTVSEEFAATRAAFRWRHLVALARVTASEFGRPAAGIAQARELLKV
ncbi:MAG TPA: hypothetical protein VN578_19885 [Candidatus Binatia bacterium]|jgi:hypothetical protein|nr:hypothetical protein [Candidatus Binatia bacterium]